MLFILFGGTLETGYLSRRFFKRAGFEIIHKYNYVAADSPIDSSNYSNPTGVYRDWFDDKIYVDQTVFEHCDFRYTLSGVNVGFNKQQILDAIHGKKDCLVTLAASSIDFIEQIKKAYGEYVTVINLFIEHATYVELINQQPGITSSEFAARMRAEKQMHHIYLNQPTLFDECVIYAGEDSPFDLSGLEQQYENIIAKRKAVEKRLNNSKYVDLPYAGTDPYIFISYSHADTNQVFPILSLLQRNSFRVWYDAGLKGGEDWREIVTQKIEDCEIFLVFTSCNARASDEVGREISWADKYHKKFLVISLDDTALKSKYEIIFQESQRLFPDADSFETQLVSALPSATRIS